MIRLLAAHLAPTMRVVLRDLHALFAVSSVAYLLRTKSDLVPAAESQPVLAG